MEEQIFIDEEHQEVRTKILELLTTKVKRVPMPFTFLKKGSEYTLAISASVAKEIGLGIKTIVIRAESPWAVYSSLALLIINSSAGTGI